MHYREGGSFTHDGTEYVLNDALAQTDGKRPTQHRVRDLEWVLAHDKADPSRVRRADTSAPVLIAPDRRGRPTVVDGLHRLTKAKQQGMTHIPGHTIDLTKHAGIFDLVRGYFERRKTSPGEFASVTSSNIDAVKYEPADKRLQVRFKSGSTYEYDNVPQSKHQQLLGAKSKGKYFHKNIRNNYTYRRLDEATGEEAGARSHFVKAAALHAFANCLFECGIRSTGTS